MSVTLCVTYCAGSRHPEQRVPDDAAGHAGDHTSGEQARERHPGGDSAGLRIHTAFTLPPKAPQRPLSAHLLLLQAFLLVQVFATTLLATAIMSYFVNVGIAWWR